MVLVLYHLSLLAITQMEAMQGVAAMEAISLSAARGGERTPVEPV